MYCEAKSAHFNEMKECSWLLGDNTVAELYEYQNLGVFKNYCSSFSTNVDENIEKATTKAGMIFSANFDRRKTNPFVYIKFWKQVCLPSLLFGVELLLSTKVFLKNSNAAFFSKLQDFFMLKQRLIYANCYFLDA